MRAARDGYAGKASTRSSKKIRSVPSSRITAARRGRTPPEPVGVRLRRISMMERKPTLETACRDFEEDLVLYYYGDGSDGERGRVEVHIRTCARRPRFLDELRQLLPP